MPKQKIKKKKCFLKKGTGMPKPQRNEKCDIGANTHASKNMKMPQKYEESNKKTVNMPNIPKILKYKKGPVNKNGRNIIDTGNTK